MDRRASVHRDDRGKSTPDPVKLEISGQDRKDETMKPYGTKEKFAAMFAFLATGSVVWFVASMYHRLSEGAYLGPLWWPVIGFAISLLAFLVILGVNPLLPLTKVSASVYFVIGVLAALWLVGSWLFQWNGSLWWPRSVLLVSLGLFLGSLSKNPQQ